MRKTILTFCAMLLAISSIDGMRSNLQAQNFDLSIYNSSDLDDAVEPILTFFGAIGGAGCVNPANLHNLAGFDVRARIVGVAFPD